MGPHGPALGQLLVELARAQGDLLVLGKVNNQSSPNIRKLSGIAYLSGGDTWVDGEPT